MEIIKYPFLRDVKKNCSAILDEVLEDLKRAVPWCKFILDCSIGSEELAAEMSAKY